MSKHCEIAGAGFAGLTAGLLLAQRGWSVRIHERASAVREVGAGIFLHHNGLCVLEEAGVLPSIAKLGVELEADRMIDERGRLMQQRRLAGDSRVWAFPREVLIQGLRTAAQDGGVEVMTDSEIVRADPKGELESADGRTWPGDVAIGADGYRSAVRTSLGLKRVEKALSTTSTRYLLKGRELAPEPVTTEHWSGSRRIALAACGPDSTYVYMACKASDKLGGKQPLDVESWSASFPRLSAVFQRLSHHIPVQGPYSFVQCSAWSSGRVALLGDAAHALAPTLGQGTNLAMSNARTLVAYLEPDDISHGLRQWEAQVRWVTDATQLWASRYDNATKRWPKPLSRLRNAVIWSFGASSYLNARMRVADTHPPHTLLKAQPAMEG